MRPSKVTQIAWKGLMRNKLRSLLTMLGVIIGVAAVIIMISISAGTEKAIEEQITGLGSNLIFVQANFKRGGFAAGGSNSGGLVYDDAFAIAEEVNGVSGVVVEQQSSQTVKAGNTTIDSVSILGSTADLPSVRDMTLATGRYFNQTEVDRNQK
jgi:putative ABC transport system permease protein